MATLTASVGNKGRNLDPDVRTVQKLLNKNIGALVPLLPLKVDGICGPVTIGMIINFQRRHVGMVKPDGRVDPTGKTLESLNEVKEGNLENSGDKSRFDGLLLLVQQYLRRLSAKSQNVQENKQLKTLTEADYVAAASLLSVDVATVKAVASVESRGGGFLSNGKPKILFEGHWFSRLTKGRYDKSHPTISYQRWTKKHYLGGLSEYTRYQAAAALNQEAAMKSTSWGSFQIMGFNYNKCGYGSVEAFVKEMHKSESYHLKAFVNFLKSAGLNGHLKAKSWSAFAKGYNGPRYAENNYDTRLEQAYKAYSSQ